MPKGNFSICVKSYEVFDSVLTDPAVHNEIVFKQGEQVIASFNGDPRARHNGEINFPSIGERDTLRVRMSPSQSLEDIDKEGQFPKVAEAELWRGDKSDALKLFSKAAEAGAYINKQNLRYVIVDAFSPGQNSNSVAHTLAEAMGLEYPPEIENLWAPGHGRVLLPKGWRSEIDGLEGDALYEYTAANLDALYEENVIAGVVGDPDPDDFVYSSDGLLAGGNRFFDPREAGQEYKQQLQQASVSGAQPVSTITPD